MMVTYPTKGMYPTTLLRPDVSLGCANTGSNAALLPDNVFPVQIILSTGVKFGIVCRIVVSFGE